MHHLEHEPQPSFLRSRREPCQEVSILRNKFLIKKLGLSVEDKLDQGIQAVIEQYGRSNRHKYRAVFYYLLVLHFGKESVYQ